MSNPVMGSSDKGYMLPFLNSRALAIAYSASLSSSVTVTLNAATKLIAISAGGKGVFVRGEATASSTAFDWFVPVDTTLYIVRPDAVTAIAIIEQATSAYVAVCEYA